MFWSPEKEKRKKKSVEKNHWFQVKLQRLILLLRLFLLHKSIDFSYLGFVVFSHKKPCTYSHVMHQHIDTHTYCCPQTQKPNNTQVSLTRHHIQTSPYMKLRYLEARIAM